MVTRVCILRILGQLIRLKKECADPAVELIVNNAITINLLNSSSLSSKDGVVQACAISVLSLLLKHQLSIKKTSSQDPLACLKMDINKVIDLFIDRSSSLDPLVGLELASLLSEILSVEGH